MLDHPTTTQGNACLKDVIKELGEDPVYALPTEVAKGVRNLGAAKVLRAEQHTAKLMVGDDGVSNWAAPRVLRGRLTSVLLMEGDTVVVIQVAQRQPVAGQAFASSTVGGRGALWKGALEVLRARQAYAFHMVEAADANSLVATREPKVTPCTVRHMVEEGGASLKAAPKGLKVAPHCARDMVEGSAASMKGVVFAQRACMVAQVTVLPMEEGNDVLCLAARRVPVVELIIV